MTTPIPPNPPSPDPSPSDSLKAIAVPTPPPLTTHTWARLCYWLSILLLLTGIWMLINPFHRTPGKLSHIFITLAAFEGYMWLLLVLARWQFTHDLGNDAVRSGVFCAILTGFLFIVLNELHLAASGIALPITVVAVGCTIFRLLAARHWLKLTLPTPMLWLIIIGVAILALPAPLLQSINSENELLKHKVGWLFCWLIALWAMLHIPVLGWFQHRRFTNAATPLGQWWSGWIITLILAIFIVIQSYAAMWITRVEWAQWYFSPFFLAFGVVAMLLAYTRHKGRTEAGIALALCLMHAVLATQNSLPRILSGHITGPWQFLVHPWAPQALFFMALFLLAAWMLRNLWLLVPAALIPFGAATWYISRFLWQLRPNKALALLFVSFTLLGVGAMLQWLQVNRRKTIESEAVDAPIAIPLDDEAEISNG
ncbi:MAG: hypothetical protein JW709_12915 [Sedimentisphaerales bacterium]|nr:hypothetical protein [Sedimentisphaerales bacterium]